MQALIFDSLYDQYRGVVSSIRVVNGVLSSREKLRFMQTGRVHEVEEIGVRLPATTEVQSLGPGEVGYLIAGIKDVGEARSGETVTEAAARPKNPSRGTWNQNRWCSAGFTRWTGTSSRISGLPWRNCG